MRSLLAAVALLAATPSILPAQPTAPRVRIVEELRLDATAEGFPTVGRVFVGPRGQIVVPITQDRQLRIYDSTGQRVAAIDKVLRTEAWATHIWVTETDADGLSSVVSYRVVGLSCGPPAC